MARQESDREDILREATGLIDRAEIRCDGWTEPVVCGFRRQGALSLFVGQDEVYQFDGRQALRRGYWHGRLLKAERGRLVELIRQRTDTETRLLRHDLSDAEQAAHLLRLQERIQWLRRSVAEKQYELIGEVSGSGQSVLERLLRWLEQFPAPPTIARVPHAR